MSDFSCNSRVMCDRQMTRSIFGFYNINKHPGARSREVVDHVQRLVRPAKAGHAGTLDPLASGVLVVGVGPATRLLPYVQRMPKRYRANFLLGRESDTEDVQGNVTELPDFYLPEREELERAASLFVGPIMQRPPRYSALKVQGERAYRLARRGENVTLAPRRVTIHQLKVVGYQYPEFQLDVLCSSGTYVRSLGRDIAGALQTVAVMSALVRTAIGTFHLQEAIDAEQLTSSSYLRYLLPASRATDDLPQVILTEDQVGRIAAGMTIAMPAPASRGEAVAALDGHGALVAIVTPRGDGHLGPVRNFCDTRR